MHHVQRRVAQVCFRLNHTWFTRSESFSLFVCRLEVGTESALDRSKSVKSSLLPLFPGNSSIEARKFYTCKLHLPALAVADVNVGDALNALNRAAAEPAAVATLPC